MPTKSFYALLCVFCAVMVVGVALSGCGQRVYPAKPEGKREDTRQY